MHGRHLTFGKLFVRKQYNILIFFLIISVKSLEVLIELSEDYNSNLSVPIPNGQTLDRLKFSQEVPLVKGGRHCYLKK